MTRGVNKVILLGNCGADISTRYFPNGGAVASVALATGESWTDKATGERKEHTEWHNIVFRNKLAETASQHLKKGSKIYVEGALRTRKWQDKDTGKDRFTTEIVVIDMQMLDGRQAGAAGTDAPRRGHSPSSHSPSQNGKAHSGGFDDDDIPGHDIPFD